MEATPVNGTANGVNGQHSVDKSDVCVVGAGPAGLMLGALVARFGLNVEILDERPDQTAVGRADGIQPKTIETFQMLRVGDELFRTGVKVHDICMWQSSGDKSLRRLGREVHYPPSIVDVLQPYILLCHQGMVEGVFVDDLRKSGFEVKRSHSFKTYSYQSANPQGALEISCDVKDHGDKTVLADYLVGCDGARSLVRKAIPDTYAQGTPHNSVWGVLDGEIETDFPDLWSKTVVFSEEHGSILIIPRERNMTRFYIEMKTSVTSKDLGEEYVKQQARLILAPYKVEWRSVEWFGNYQVAQRVAARFSDPQRRAFIAGDASHTHSPKAAQGMNTSMHDSWNLGWKLNLTSRGLVLDDVLLESYEEERKKIAHDLINFDFEHANEIAAGDAARLAENFRQNTRFISGIGVEYGLNKLNLAYEGDLKGAAKPGCNLPPAKVTRFMDASPVDIQLDIPMLGQFRVYAILGTAMGVAETSFLAGLNNGLTSESSIVSRLSAAAAKSYKDKPRPRRSDDTYVRPERYTAVSELITYSLISSAEKKEFEIASLPPFLAKSGWTVYLDDVPNLDTQGRKCTDKWLGALDASEAAIVTVRPDGYVGAVKRWSTSDSSSGEAAATWLDGYFGGFLKAN
ncbi:FAD binding domain-containing protein [Dactylonectria macrodidyma]|uniref:FAD binding domain-containing protein n=1 Tax=Dactylonectria macrodidyma TaxID=307937 RepID=A0A9P9IKZ1_9HYPO|nr:FAD binding domain-containing protein [Dactylonectria macrodidyma]